MLERDYILRIIQDLFKFLGKLLKLLQEEEIEKAYDLMVDKTQKLFKTDYHQLLASTDEDLKAWMNKKSLSSDFLDALGRYFMVTAEVCMEMKKRGEGQKQLELARFFFNQSEEQFKTFSFERQIYLEQVNEQLIRMKGESEAD